MTKKVGRIRLFVLLLAVIAALAFVAPLGETESISAADKIAISSVDDLIKIGVDASYPLTGDYVQTADIDFTGADANGGIDITASVAVTGSTATVTVKYWDGATFVPAASGSVLLAGSATPVSIKAGTATVSSFDSTVNNAIAVYGTIGGEPTAIVVEIPKGVASVAVEESSNGNFDPIGAASSSAFVGTYDGNGYKIVGLKTAVYKATAITAFSALFGFIGAGASTPELDSDIVIENITIENGCSVSVVVNSTTNAYTGGLVGRAIATRGTTIDIRNCEVNSAVYGFGVSTVTATAGGIIGAMQTNAANSAGGVINVTDCVHAYGNVLSESTVANRLSRVGGIVGYVSAEANQTSDLTEFRITGSRNEADIWVRSYGALFVGGLTGQVLLKDPTENAITDKPRSLVVGDFTNKGNISAWSYAGVQYVGGVMGSSYNGSSYVTGCVEASFDRCLNYGDISGVEVSSPYYSWVGGLFGYIAGDYHGNVYTWTVSNSFNVGKVSAKALNGAARAGGIAATSYVFSVEDSFNAGDVHTDAKTQTFAGGIIGLIMKHTEISGSYNAGDVYAAGINYAAAGGFVGYADWDSDSDLASGTQLVIKNGYNAGNINAESTVYAGLGGALGLIDTRSKAWNYATVDKFYNIGSIDAVAPAHDIGAIAGEIAGTGGGAEASVFTDVYFLDNLADSYGSAGTGALNAANYADPGAGQRTAAELNAAATFAGWDLTSVWGIYEDSSGATYSGHKTPYLRTTGNSVLVEPLLSSGATAAAHPAYNAGPNYRTADPLTGELGYDGASFGSAPTAPGTYAIVPGTLDQDGPHFYQVAMLLGTFELLEPTHTITATASSGASVAPSGAVVVADGGGRIFTFKAVFGYAVDSVVVDRGQPGEYALTSSQISSGSYTFTAVSADHTIDVVGKAAPRPADRIIQASSDAGSNITPSGGVVVADGGIGRFDFSPMAGHRIEGVSVDGVPLSAEDIAIGYYVFYNVASDHTIIVASVPVADDAPRLEPSSEDDGSNGWIPLVLLLSALIAILAVAGAVRHRRQKA